MARTITYEGYTIQSTPHEIAGEKWRLHIRITGNDHRGVRTSNFPAQVLYTSEQEADIHGITFGQRVIDGKVEGLSVMDLKPEDRRATPRFRVQFRTTFSVSPKPEATGILLDLSAGGCRIESPLTPEPGFSLELRIHVPDIEWPLMIEGASVQWVSGHMFGLGFVRLREAERERLRQVIERLAGDEDRGD
ncbi:MAG: PilZ domain-containing protein [Nitrospiraceae bacterium]|nr:PilZ domain-containing protein [Nitrospiraceae bacterium]